MVSEGPNFRRYERDRDREPVMRIFRECGWIGEGAAAAVPMESLIDGASEAWVATVKGVPEVLVLGALGELSYGGKALPAGVITGVVASLVCRRQGLAGRLTAYVVARLATAGAVVTTLGMFDQGYYERLGFGQGTYDHFVWLDPERLTVPLPTRPPERLGHAHAAEMHAARWRRLRCHGAISIDGVGNTRESLQSEAGLGLGYRDDSGRLTHYAWFRRIDPDAGPWLIHHHSFETWPQYMELLGLVRSLGDQVRLVRLTEPPGVNLQSLTSRPFRHLGKTKGSAYPEKIQAMAWNLFRINDVAATTAAIESHAQVKFRLRLMDPVAQRLKRDDPDGWRGIAGEYQIALSPKGCKATSVAASKTALPTLVATVNQWTAWWLGVSPASVLEAQGGFQASSTLLTALDAAIRLPRSSPDWDY